MSSMTRSYRLLRRHGPQVYQQTHHSLANCVSDRAAMEGYQPISDGYGWHPRMRDAASWQLA